jgi:FlaA1/EpsC-like NDP-sugar epimerase
MMDPWISEGRKLLRNVERVYTMARTHLRLHHLLLVAVFVLAGVSFWLSYELRFDFHVPDVFHGRRVVLLPYVAFLKVVAFYFIGGHSANWRYFGLRDVPTLFVHGAICSVMIFVLSASFSEFWVPRGVIAIDFLLSTMLIGSLRIGLRLLRERSPDLFHKGVPVGRKPAIVIGAGDAGEMIIREMLRNRDNRFDVQALFDDDKTKQGLSIHGISVEGGVDDIPLYLQEKQVDVAIVAIPTATNAQMRRIYDLLKPQNLSVRTLPSLIEMMDEPGNLNQLREINITDLLGREEVHIDTVQVRNLIQDKVVVITGAGGSIGSELCRQVLKRGPKAIVLMERYENNLFHIYRNLSERRTNIPVVPLLCDVTDAERVECEFAKYRPELVFHAAAHKHVPLQEINASECFRNNVGGIQTLARAADRFGVSAFLLISTDKAVNPTSVMGATKRVCEMYCQALAAVSSTRFLSVRFGNVLASEGSVVPIFLEQIEKGGPVTVTHPDMKRYFMTIPEAVTLVLQATALGESGQIMILDMGSPVKILDLVHHLIQLAGKTPEEVSIEFIGPRPGEKLFEELSCCDEVCIQTAHSKIKVFHQNGRVPRDAAKTIDSALDMVRKGIGDREVRRLLRQIVPEYDSGDIASTEEDSPAEPPSRILGGTAQGF